MIAQAKRVSPGCAQHGVLHNDALFAELDPAAFRSQDGSEQDPAVGADVHVPAHDRGRRDISAGVNLRRRSAMLQQHAFNPFHRVIGTVSLPSTDRPILAGARGCPARDAWPFPANQRNMLTESGSL